MLGKDEPILGSCFADCGVQFYGLEINVNGHEVIPDGLIQHAYVTEYMKNVEIQPMPEPVELGTLQGTPQGTLKVLGWVSIDCFPKQQTRSVTFPRRRWTMVCLVIDADEHVEDVIIGTTGIKKWRILNGGRPRWKFWMLKYLYPSHKPEPSMHVPYISLRCG
jgi:hypothetical protein